MATISQQPARQRLQSLTEPSGVLIVNGAALTVVLLHVLIDYHIGLYGPTSEMMTPAQAANAFRIAVTAGGWMIALGVSMRGSRTGTACTLAFVVVWGFILHGLVAFLVVPPPSAAFPYQDSAHVGGIVFGGLAAYVLGVNPKPRWDHRSTLSVSGSWVAPTYCADPRVFRLPRYVKGCIEIAGKNRSFSTPK